MSVAHLADTGLPFNRKERYFTGTVFPMLVCADNFAHFGRLTELAGLGRIDVDASPTSANVQFFTEYSLAESLIGDAKTRFPGAPTRKDTPDVLIYVAAPRRALIAIEAKMYDRPTTAELNEQLALQAALVRYITGRLEVEDTRIAHVALLPAALASKIGTLLVPTVTWEHLLETYADVAPPYFLEVLRVALARHEQLASPRPTFGANAEMKLTGAEIYERHRAGSITTPWMGRKGGLNGAELTSDIASGTWRVHLYECSSKPVQNTNWFTVAEFVARVATTLPPR
ncbi:hypothetical protein [Polyangium aurulentum]|uniref:hypothetical protein n=1 Tax=Polyangium aurulentum TaxID=2567896 RepID=UPI0010ADD85B|nr:hypothetical protein [Polyangium aurulentum]UQA57101.1 hypothetical protein E8A73_038295 [Polyangium aurulentum]